jgi:hypothetical protein
MKKEKVSVVIYDYEDQAIKNRILETGLFKNIDFLYYVDLGRFTCEEYCRSPYPLPKEIYQKFQKGLLLYFLNKRGGSNGNK